MQLLMDLVFMIDVLLWRFTEHDYSVQVNKGKLPYNAGHDHLHSMLECAGCAAKSEWHAYYNIRKWLLTSKLQSHSQACPCICPCVVSGESLGSLLRYVYDSQRILESFVFLGDKKYRCGPLGFCRLDDIFREHLADLSFFKLSRF